MLRIRARESKINFSMNRTGTIANMQVKSTILWTTTTRQKRIVIYESRMYDELKKDE